MVFTLQQINFTLAFYVKTRTGNTYFSVLSDIPEMLYFVAESKVSMKKRRWNKKDIIAMAGKTQYYCDLLTEQCGNWLPEKENNELRISKKSQYLIKKRRKMNIVVMTLILFACFSVCAFG